MSTAEPDAMAAPGPSGRGLDGAAVIEALRREMDVLRQQLDVAFDEVVGRVDGVELRLTALRSAIDEAVAASHQTRPPDPAIVDLGSVAARLGQLDERLATKLTESRIRLEGGLDQLHHQIAELRDAPIELDTRTLEDAAHRESLRNAADIATLRQTVERLTEAVRRQSEDLAELRTTLGWIKERLLR
ncbi:MAG: hypothetical protein ABIP36_02460 [Acidimicrobiales bacterium]